MCSHQLTCRRIDLSQGDCEVVADSLILIEIVVTGSTPDGATTIYPVNRLFWRRIIILRLRHALWDSWLTATGLRRADRHVVTVPTSSSGGLRGEDFASR